MNQKEYDTLNRFTPRSRFSWKQKASKKLQSLKQSKNPAPVILKFLHRRLPCTKWLRQYRWRRWIMGDVMAGITLGIYNIPQGMAYSVLASLPPVYGLYASFYPPLLYFLFGSSFHSSIGVFSITSLLTGQTRLALLPDNQNSTATVIGNMTDVDAVDIVSTLSFAVGVFQLLMAGLHLDFLTAYLSDPVISGFNIGAACHALIAQIPPLLGVKVAKRDTELLVIFKRAMDIIHAVARSNWVTVACSVCSILFLVFSKIVIQKHLNLFPAELLLMLVATLVSYFSDFSAAFKVKIINRVATGIPPPRAPVLALLPYIWHEAVSIGIVSFAVTVSMGKLFAKKHKYSIDSNQELLALGLSGTISSFFSVFPCTTSLSRSLVNEAAGAKSQISGLVSSGIVLLVIIKLGPLLSTLPLCVLSSIVVVALRSLFLKVTELPYLWRFSRTDFTIWIITALATICYDIIPGLTVGILFAILTIVFRTQFAHTRRLVEVTPGDFRDKRHFPSAHIPETPVLRFDAPPCFTNCEVLRDSIHAEAEKMNVRKLSMKKCVESDSEGRSSIDSEGRSSIESADSNDSDSNGSQKAAKQDIWRTIVLDCSTWTYTDSMGVETVRELHLEMCNRHILLLFANVRSSVRVQYTNSGLTEVLSTNQFFPTVTDALNLASEITVPSSFLPFPDLHKKLERYLGGLP